MGDDPYQEASADALDLALWHTAAYAPWRTLDPGLGASLDERYAALPVTDKAFMRAAFPKGLVPDGKNLDAGLRSGQVEFVPTSGTTDEQITNVWNQRWWDFSERQSWTLNGALSALLGDHPREAILTSARNVGFLSDGRELPFEERTLGRLLYLNERSTPLLWDDGTITRMAAELERHSPRILEANPSYLAAFARKAARLGCAVPEPDVIVFTYENPSLLHLSQIRQVFRAPLVSSYGTTEAGYILMQCECGTHHLNAASCRVDFEPLRGAHDDVGLLRVTPFGNEWVSLLRYDPGDVVRRRSSGPCPCGRDSAFLADVVEGRAKSLTWSTEGRPITQGELDRCLAAEESLVMYQMLQEGEGRYALRVVLGEAGGKGAPDRLRDALLTLYGPSARVAVDACTELAPEASGKYLLAKTVAPADGARP